LSIFATTPNILTNIVAFRSFVCLFSAFDTSCFSGEYVTGEKITDQYFQDIYARRNKAKKEEEEEQDALRATSISNHTPSKLKPKQSNGGIESIANDMRV
jgi:hypothetical protein